MKKQQRFTRSAIALACTLCIGFHANAALTDGLVAYYPFNGNAQDFSGNGNHGLINGNVTFIAGAVGTGAKFNGVNSAGGSQNPDYIHVPNSASLKLNGAMSISYWVRIDGNRAQTGSDCSGSAVSGAYGVAFGRSGDRAGFDIMDYEKTSVLIFPTGNSLTTSNVANALGAFRHVSYTVDASANTLYINGVKVNSGSGNSNFSITNTQDIYIGTSVNNGACLNFWYPLDGVVDELRVYDRVLTANEVMELANSQSVTNKPTQSNNLVDLILSNNRAALNYSTNTLTVPTLDIPQAGSSPLTFSSTWKATNAAAPNAVFYLADAQQIANVSNPTATFDPVTFTVNMPNVITSGSNNGTDGLAAQKYQVIVEGSTLGLVRMGATLNCTPPQVAQNGQCVTPALNFKSLGTWQTLSGRPVFVSLYGADIGKVASATLEGNSCSVSSARSVGSLKTFECPSPVVGSETVVYATLNYTDGRASTKVGPMYINSQNYWTSYNGQFYVDGAKLPVLVQKTDGSVDIDYVVGSLTGNSSSIPAWTYFNAIKMSTSNGTVSCPVSSTVPWRYSCPSVPTGSATLNLLREQGAIQVAGSSDSVQIISQAEATTNGIPTTTSVPVTPTCYAPQVLQGNVCVTPSVPVNPAPNCVPTKSNSC